MKGNSKKDWSTVLKMKPRSIIDAPKEETPFQIDENDNPINLGDIDIDDDVEIVPEEKNDTDSNVDEEVGAIDGAYVQDWHEGLLEEDNGNVYEDDDDYFTIMQCTLMTNLYTTYVLMCWNLC